MQYPVVVILSGPEKTRAKAELALEKARLTIIPPNEWPIQRQSYQAEHWSHLTPYPMVRLPEKKGKPERNEYAPAPFVDTDEQWGHVAVLAETEALFHASYACVEKAGWVLRQHYELPEKPKPELLPELIGTLLGRLDSQEQRIAELTRKLGGLPSIGGAAFEAGAGEFMQAGTYSAAQMRRTVLAWAQRTSANTPGLISGGLFSATDMQLSNAVSGLVAYTSTGECVIPGTEATSQGGYHAFMSSQNSTTLATASGANPRIDLICATAADAAYTIPSGGTSGSVTINAVTGTPTSGASLTNLSGAPTLPASSLLLGYVLVPQSATNLVGADILNKATAIQTQAAGQLLAAKSYNPGSQSTYAFSSATWTYPDTTNLAITAIVPSSGRMLIGIAGGQIQANGTTAITAGINTSSSGVPAWQQSIGTATNTTSSGDGMINMMYQANGLLVGLTPGASQTFYAGIYGVSTNGNLYVGGVSNALILTATSA